MKLVELKLYSGGSIAINTKYINVMYPSYDRGTEYTQIVMNSGKEYTVHIEYKVLMRHLVEGKING